MARTEAKRKADNKWRAEKMHRIAIDCTLRDYDTIASAAGSVGLPVGTFCRRAIMGAVTDPGRLEKNPGGRSEADPDGRPEEDPGPDLQRAPFVPDP